MDYKELDLRGISAERQWDVSEAFPILMRKVYVWMTLALVITGFTAYGVATSPGILQAIFSNQILFWGLIIAEFALVIGVSAAINKLSLTTATLMFILYSVINGATLSIILLAYTMSSVATVFFITAGTFAAMALVGYTTKTDLTSIGKIVFMALIGLIIATIVNIFVKSTGLTLILNYVGVLVFVGLTAYDTQKIKVMSAAVEQSTDAAPPRRFAILGALTLYLDFINLFLYILRLLGRNRD